MTYKNINFILLSRLPELSIEIMKEIDYWKGEDVPSHILFAEVFNQNGFLSDLLSDEPKVKLINKVFVFFEDMANCDDEEVRNLLKVTILEFLWGDFELLSRAHKYMHTQTRKLSDELKVFFKPFKIE